MSKRANRSGRPTRRRHGGRAGGAGGADAVLPALSSLTDLPAPDELRPSERQLREFAAERDRLVRVEEVPESEVDLGCVVRLDRGYPAVMSRRGVTRCEFAAALTKGGENSRAAVGDWVAIRRPEGHDMGMLCSILTRESDIARWRGGARGERQTLAANVGTVLVAQALGPVPVPTDRIVRSAVIAADCGARVAVVLTKADRAGADLLVRDVELVHEALGGEVPVVATCAGTPGDETSAPELEGGALSHGAAWGIEAVRALVPRGEVAIVLGESGAGKSTLLNALLGHDALETGDVRSSDDAGRHTTVARRMVSLPGAGVIVDEPGLRSLPLVGHERGLVKVFPEISSHAADCRFRDCTHTHEPGCAVRAAYEEGAFPKARLDAYVSLAAEMRASARTLDPDVVL